MDGDGKAASDLPYSIEDVPYVQYFEGSYALHGAFWHNNFGHEMSHGCVNLRRSTPSACSSGASRTCRAAGTRSGRPRRTAARSVVVHE